LGEKKGVGSQNVKWLHIFSQEKKGREADFSGLPVYQKWKAQGGEKYKVLMIAKGLTSARKL